MDGPEGGIAIAVASSGIVSPLPMGARTAHFTFKIPLKLDSVCNIYKQSHFRNLIVKTSLLT